MELTNIEINNFRSIKSEVIEMKHNCLVFVGKMRQAKVIFLKQLQEVYLKKPLDLPKEINVIC